MGNYPMHQRITQTVSDTPKAGMATAFPQASHLGQQPPRNEATINVSTPKHVI